MVVDRCTNIKIQNVLNKMIPLDCRTCIFCPSRENLTRFHNEASSLGGMWHEDMACESCRLEHNKRNQETIRQVKLNGPTQITTTVSSSTLNFMGSTIESNCQFPIPPGSVVSIETAQIDSFDKKTYPTRLYQGGGTAMITGSPNATMYLVVAVWGNNQ